jgi:hypothetical protein
VLQSPNHLIYRDVLSASPFLQLQGPAFATIFPPELTVQPRTSFSRF